MTSSEVDIAGPPAATEATQDLEPLALTALTATDYWNDSCSIEDLTYAIERGTTGATSNPTIVGEVTPQRRVPHNPARLLATADAARPGYCNVAEAIVRIRGAVMTKALAGGLLPFRAKQVLDESSPGDRRGGKAGRAGQLSANAATMAVGANSLIRRPSVGRRDSECQTRPGDERKGEPVVSEPVVRMCVLRRMIGRRLHAISSTRPNGHGHAQGSVARIVAQL
jgi:hypothetical protein